MNLRFATLTLATLAVSTIAFGAASVTPATTDGDTGYQVRYAANLTAGESYIDMVNAGDSGSTLCANLYAFNYDEEMVSCCSCSITVNGVVDIPVNAGLLFTTLTGSALTQQLGITIEEYTTPGPCTTTSAGSLSASSTTLVPGIKAWGTTLHQNTATSSYGLTETPFTFALSHATGAPDNFATVATECYYLQLLGSGPGQCKGCSEGALGASKN